MQWTIFFNKGIKIVKIKRSIILQIMPFCRFWVYTKNRFNCFAYASIIISKLQNMKYNISKVAQYSTKWLHLWLSLKLKKSLNDFYAFKSLIKMISNQGFRHALMCWTFTSINNDSFHSFLLFSFKSCLQISFGKNTFFVQWSAINLIIVFWLLFY